jgi:hypothetical protein
LLRKSNAVTISSRLHYGKTDYARRSDWIDVPWVKSAVPTVGGPLPVYSDNQHHQTGPACLKRAMNGLVGSYSIILARWT